MVQDKEEELRRKQLAGEGPVADEGAGVGEAAPHASQQAEEDVDLYSLPRQVLAAALGAAGARIRPGMPARSLLLHAPVITEASDTEIAVRLTSRRDCEALLCAVHRMSQLVTPCVACTSGAGVAHTPSPTHPRAQCTGA